MSEHHTTLLIIVAAGLLLSVALRFLAMQMDKARFGTPFKEPATLEQRLELLADCGFRLTSADPSRKLPDQELVDSCSHLSILRLIDKFCIVDEKQPPPVHFANLWCFLGQECIGEHGDYRLIIERMVDISQGSLVLNDIRDFVDPDHGTAWFSFTFRDQQIRVDCNLVDGWVDRIVFTKLAELLRTADPDKLFVCYDTGEEELYLGCVTRIEYERLQDSGSLSLFERL